jgi:7-dehydrocholesterol reductase
MVLAPPAALLLWVAGAHHGGSARGLAAAMADGTAFSQLPLPSLWAAAVLGAWAVFAWALLRFLPGETYWGPPSPAGERPRYRANGLLAWLFTHGLLLIGFSSGVLSGSTLFRRYGEILATSCVLAFALCAGLRAKGAWSPSGADLVRTKNPIFDFFQGVELHPRAFGVDLKQLVNCRISMMGWSAIVVAMCAHQIESLGHLTVALGASAVLVEVYLLKFFVWETGYFNSLDIVHDRFGFYICWGVLVWVPAVYPIAQLQLATTPRDLSWPAGLAIVLLGLVAIFVNYSADAQRQRVRATSGAALVWGKHPRLIEATYETADGAVRKNLLLVSGYWALARHFHYLPELTVALAWTLPVGASSAVAYFYVLFLAALLLDRVGRDDRRCEAKYGAAWAEYRRLVPFKVVPGLF